MLHTPTLLATIIVASFSLTLAIAVVAFRRDRTLSSWAWALFAHTVAYVLFALRGQISDVLSIVLANTAIAATFALFARAVIVFQQRLPGPWHHIIWWPVPLTAVLFSYFIDNLTARLILNGPLFAGQALLVVYLLFQRRRETPGRGQYILASGFVLIALIFLLRTLLALKGEGDSLTLESAASIHTVTFLSSIVGLMMLAVGLVLMVSERHKHQLESREAYLEDLAEHRTRTLEETRTQLSSSEERFRRAVASIELHQIALTEARDLAEAASRAKTSFLANMSHELRTPLNAILGFTDLMWMKTQDEKQKHQLDMVRQAGQRLLRIISDVLDAARLDSEQLALNPAPFTLGPVIEHVVSLLGHDARAKNIDLRVDVPAELLQQRLLGDRERIEQILLNLIGNAIKFTEQGFVAVRVSVCKDNADSLLLGVVVEDSGIGIAPEVQQRLFLPFEQADSSSTRRHGGMGIGLLISRRLAQMMGGDLSVHSQPGKGSVFSLTLLLTKQG